MIGLDAIKAARSRIAGHILQTPFVPSSTLSEMCGVPVGLKLEHHQTTGSFKLRGATNAILSLSEAERTRGVVAASTGNHGRALAHAARAVGSRATICRSWCRITRLRKDAASARMCGSSAVRRTMRKRKSTGSWLSMGW